MLSNMLTSTRPRIFTAINKTFMEPKLKRTPAREPNTEVLCTLTIRRIKDHTIRRWRRIIRKEGIAATPADSHSKVRKSQVNPRIRGTASKSDRNAEKSCGNGGSSLTPVLAVEQLFELLL